MKDAKFESPHIPVLCEQWISFLKEKAIKTYVDGTLGAGGHAEAVLKEHPEIESFIGFDQDPTALKIAEKKLEPWKEKVHFIQSNFSQMKSQLREMEVTSIDALLLDIGVSSMQLDTPERGFSFSNPGPLDMRMDPNQSLTAETIVNEWSQEEITRIFRDYGEERRARLAAQKIVNARKEKSFKTTQELVDLLYPVLKDWDKKKKIHPLTKVFQALRIAVNDELGHLERVLPQAMELLNPGGVLGLITFHSLEDRIVKRYFQYEASDKQNSKGLAGLFLDKTPRGRILTRKPVRASEDEIEENPRTRSAVLRVLERL